MGNVPYFKMFIRLYDEPSMWFHNLQILQVRVKLRHDDYYHVTGGIGNSHQAKIEAIRAIVRTERLMDCSVPPLLIQPTRRDFSNLANERAMSLCLAGLRARRNCNGN